MNFPFYNIPLQLWSELNSGYCRQKGESFGKLTLMKQFIISVKFFF